MDLRETRGFENNRHPWETSRATAIGIILKDILNQKKGLRILDMGCGDGFICRELSMYRGVESITGVDINLSEEQIAELSKAGDRVTYLNRSPDAAPFDLILLLDVLEHVDDDKAFLKWVAERYLDKDGYLLITVPMFQCLYGAHDRLLGHFRRYSMKGLAEIIECSGLRCLSNGGLFASLVLPRFLSVTFQKMFRMKENATEGVGAWKLGKGLTRAVEMLLRADNRILLIFSKLGIDMPGLTGWALCKRQQ